MKISYAVTVCNEYKEVEKLLSFLFENKRKEDEVVVQMDFDNSTTEVVKACEKWESKQSEEYKLIQCSLSKNFAQYKNNLTKTVVENGYFK